MLGDFNINFMQNSSQKKTPSKYLTEQEHYVQLVNLMTTDYKTQIDHIYTNSLEIIYCSGVLKSYFSHHEPIFVSLI